MSILRIQIERTFEHIIQQSGIQEAEGLWMVPRVVFVLFTFRFISPALFIQGIRIAKNQVNLGLFPKKYKIQTVCMRSGTIFRVSPSTMPIL